MIYKERHILAIGEEFVIYALPHQQKLIDLALKNKVLQKKLKARVKKYENGTKNNGVPLRRK